MSQITRREMSGGEGSENGSPSYGVGVVAAQIVASKKGQYKVEWAGVDPRTGGQRTPSWVPKEQCDEELVDVWRAGRAEREKRKRWVGRALSVGHSERVSRWM